MENEELCNPELEENLSPQIATKTRKQRRRSRLPNMSKKREKANDRERSRMADVRVGFKELRKCIPGKFAPTYKHLPKIQILNFAMSYISELSQILQSDEKQGIGAPDYSTRSAKTPENFLEQNAVDLVGEPLTPLTSESSPAPSEEDIRNRFGEEPGNTRFLNSTSQVTYEVVAEGASSILEECLDISGLLTPLSPASSESLWESRVMGHDTEKRLEIGDLLTPVSSEEEDHFNLDNYLDDSFSGTLNNFDFEEYPDFTKYLTSTECDEILSHVV